MKTLYESILDDEDILISDIKKISQNWLLVLKNAMLNFSGNDDEIVDFMNSGEVKKAIKPLFHKFDGRVRWIAGKHKYGVFCMLIDQKEKSKYYHPPVISFILYPDNDFLTIKVSNYNNLTLTTRKNTKEDELLKFKEYIIDNGAKRSLTNVEIEKNDKFKI